MSFHLQKSALIQPVICLTDQLVACFQFLEFVFSRRPRQGGSGEPRYLHFLKTYSGIAAAAAEEWNRRRRRRGMDNAD